MLFPSILHFFVLSASVVKLFFFLYFGSKTELLGQKDQLEKKFFHESYALLIYKIKHKEELLKDILLLGKWLDFSKPFAFHLQNRGKRKIVFFL